MAGFTTLVTLLAGAGHFILGETHYEQRRPGKWKSGEYGYPHTMIHDGYLYVIVSRQKEAVEVLRVALAELGDRRNPVEWNSPARALHAVHPPLATSR